MLPQFTCFTKKRSDYVSLYKQYSWVEKDWGGHQMAIDLRELNRPLILHLSGRDFVGR
jgi:hypothetical protein